VLEQQLAYRLHQLLKVEKIESPQCWFERSDGMLELEAGPFCEPTLRATFRKVNGEWQRNSEDAHPLVLCHERHR
jgi:hypothetical protein